MKNKKVLVTGAGGFIGSHLCEKLVEYGADVTALIRYNSKGSHGFLETSAEEIKNKINFISGDIRDEETFNLHLNEKDYVFHLAAVPGIPYSFIYPQDIFENNTRGPLNLMNAARKMKAPPKIVLVSSAETYGDNQYLPIDEKHPQFPKSPYAASKAAMEKFAFSFIYAYELPVNIVRLFNNYGPRQSARAVTPTIISQLLAGDMLKIGSVTPKRDFTFVLDTIEALIRVAQVEENGEIFNIGSNCYISIREIIDFVARVLDKKDFKIETDESRIRPANSEVPALMADYAKLRARTGWEPKYNYYDGIKLTVEWMAENIHLYKTGAYNI